MGRIWTGGLREDDLYLAGDRVPPGRYVEIETGRVVQLERSDVLPASLDGHVACYARRDHIWSQHAASGAHGVQAAKGR